MRNRLRPALNGTRRRVDRVGRCHFDGTLLDADGAGKPGVRGSIPTRVRDIAAG